MAFLVTGCALALRRRWALGITFISLAAGVKLPAAAAIVYLGWHRAGVGAAVKERLRVVGRSLAAMAAITLTLCAVIGISLYGWIENMQNSGRTMGTLSLTTRIGYVVSSICRAVGLPSSDSVWTALFRLAGLAIAAALCLVLLRFTDRIGAIQCAALAMLAVVLLGPVVWPWYLAPAIALFGASGVSRWRPSLLVLTIAFAFEVFPVGPKSKPVLEGSHFVSLGLILLIGVLTIVAPFGVEWWRELREPPPSTDLLGYAPAD
jgi:hypothetical protein